MMLSFLSMSIKRWIISLPLESTYLKKKIKKSWPYTIRMRYLLKRLLTLMLQKLQKFLLCLRNHQVLVLPQEKTLMIMQNNRRRKRTTLEAQEAKMRCILIREWLRPSKKQCSCAVWLTLSIQNWVNGEYARKGLKSSTCSAIRSSLLTNTKTPSRLWKVRFSLFLSILPWQWWQVSIYKTWSDEQSRLSIPRLNFPI